MQRNVLLQKTIIHRFFQRDSKYWIKILNNLLHVRHNNNKSSLHSATLKATQRATKHSLQSVNNFTENFAEFIFTCKRFFIKQVQYKIYNLQSTIIILSIFILNLQNSRASNTIPFLFYNSTKKEHILSYSSCAILIPRFSNRNASTLRTRRVSLAAILTQRWRHGLAETSFRAIRWRGGCLLCRWGLRGIGQRCPG